MNFPGLPPRCEHLPDPVPVPRGEGWLSIDAAAALMGWRAEHVRGTWNRLAAETWATGGAMAGGSPVRMALCSDGFLDEWCLDERGVPAFRKEFHDLDRAAFAANKGPDPAGPMTNEWLSFGQVTRRMGSSQRNVSLQTFWISVTHPQTVDRREESYMRGVRLSLRTDERTGNDLWALRAADFDGFGEAYLAALHNPAPRKANVRRPGEISCEEGWALFGRTLDWTAYFHSWEHLRGRGTAPTEPTYKTMAQAFAVARGVANRKLETQDWHTPVPVLMSRVEPDLRPTVKGMLKEFEEAGTLGAIGPLSDGRPVVRTVYVGGVPLPSLTDDFKDRFLAEARRRLSPPCDEAEPARPFGM